VLMEEPLLCFAALTAGSRSRVVSKIMARSQRCGWGRSALSASASSLPPASESTKAPVSPNFHTASHEIEYFGDDVELRRQWSALTEARRQRVHFVLEHRTQYLAVVLDGVHGMHNIAAVLRSCDAFGVQCVNVVENSNSTEEEEEHDQTIDGEEAEMSRRRRKRPSTRSILEGMDEPTARKVNKGAHKWLSLRSSPSATELLDQLRDQGYRVLVSSVSADTRPIYDVDYQLGPVAFVFGNERTGVSAAMQNAADGFFTIPQRGFVESYNVSVAVAVTLTDATNRALHQVGPSKYYMTMEGKRQLLSHWLAPKQPKQSEKPTLARSSVTTLGVLFERAVLKRGVFVEIGRNATLENQLRLSVALGIPADNYMQRRKSGAVSDTGYSKRCTSIIRSVSGICALLTAAALNEDSPSPLLRYFEDVVIQVNKRFEPVFDDQGIPLAQRTSAALKRYQTVVASIPAVCRTSAQAYCAAHGLDLGRVISKANLSDLINLVQMMSRVPVDQVFQDPEDIRNSVRMAGMEVWMNPNHREMIAPLEYIDEIYNQKGLVNDSERECLFVSLRVYQCGWLASEVHRAIWDKQDRGITFRLKSIKHSTLERVIVDSFASARMIEHSASNSDKFCMGFVLFELLSDVYGIGSSFFDTNLQNSSST